MEAGEEGEVVEEEADAEAGEEKKEAEEEEVAVVEEGLTNLAV